MANLTNLREVKRNMGPKKFIVLVQGQGLYFFASEQEFRQRKVAKLSYTLTARQEDQLTIEGFCNKIC